jgi:hypothetical protein
MYSLCLGISIYSKLNKLRSKEDLFWNLFCEKKGNSGGILLFILWKKSLGGKMLVVTFIRLNRVLICCVEFRELSHLTRDLSQAEKKLTVVTSWATDKKQQI